MLDDEVLATERSGYATARPASATPPVLSLLGRVTDLWRRVRRDSLRYQTLFIRCREDFPHLLNARSLLGVGVEVGVQYGYYSEVILSAWKGKTLYSVDPWAEFDSSVYDDVANGSQDSQEAIYQGTVQRLRRFGDRSRVIRATSTAAAERFGDGQLDFVYLDAQHHYEAVKEDIRAWCPKIRRGGVLAGHDYLDGQIDEGLFGVKSAVDEFAGITETRVVLSREKRWKSWFVFV